MLIVSLTACTAVEGPVRLALPTSEPVPLNPFATPTACPTALLSGILVRSPASVLGVRADVEGHVIAVRWPAGYFATDEGVLVLRDADGGVVAREGESFEAGGGMDAAESFFVVCGQVESK